MRTWLAALTAPLLLLFHSSASVALPPVKSQICLAMFRQLALTDPLNQAPPAYAINSLAAFRDQVLRISEANPSIADGFISNSTHSLGFGRKEAASRISGIEAFAHRTESAAPGERNFTRAVTITGRENIERFLDEFSENLRIADEHFRHVATKDFQTITGLNAVILGSINWDRLAHLPPDMQAAAGGGLALMQLLWKQDFIFARPLHWDFSFRGQLQKLKEAALQPASDSKSYALLSKNFYIRPSTTKALRARGADEELFRDEVKNQSYAEALPLRDRLEVAALGKEELTARSWVGMDLFVEAGAQGEPELHVVLRGTENKPPFPKKSTAKEAAPRPMALPEGEAVPGLVPVPVPVRKP